MAVAKPVLTTHLDETKLLIVILVFGAIGLITTAVVQTRKNGLTPIYFVKLFGLVFIGTLAAAIVFVHIDSEARTGAYTILGTIAGYLAGSKIPGGDDGPDGEDNGKPSQKKPKVATAKKAPAG